MNTNNGTLTADAGNHIYKSFTCATLASVTLQEGRGVTAKQGVKIKVLIGSLKTIKLTQVNHFIVYHTYHSGEIV